MGFAEPVLEAWVARPEANGARPCGQAAVPV
jgi:hypothetical protein